MAMRADAARALCITLGMAAACMAQKAPESGPAAGQIVAHPANPRWLVRYDPGGRHKPFFMCGPGDPEGFLYRGKLRADGTRDGDQLKLIKKLKGTGANCVYLMAVRSHGGDGDRTENPFIDNDPKKGLNPKVLEQWDGWFAEMDRAGIVIYLFLYDDSARIWKTGDAVGMPEKRFIQALVKRFKRHTHLIWCVAEEYQERFSAKRVSAIAAAIRKADDRRHPIAVHKLSGLDFSDTDFHEMAPHDELARGDTEYVLARPGRAYIAYSSRCTRELGLTGRFEGTYDLRWFDCATGKTVTRASVKISAVNASFARPAGLGKEVALYLCRRERAKPVASRPVPIR